jgi:hypothetical protein
MSKCLKLSIAAAGDGDDDDDERLYQPLKWSLSYWVH